MLDIKVDKKLVAYTTELVRNNNFGNRGHYDGDKNQQFVGILSENCVRQLWGYPLVGDSVGFDGGYDLLWNGLKIDVKSMTRAYPMKPHYVHNVIDRQINYQAEAFLFCSLNIRNSILTICGWIEKEEFKRLAKFYKSGTVRVRDNGTTFSLDTDNWEIENKHLKPFNYATTKTTS